MSDKIIQFPKHPSDFTDAFCRELSTEADTHALVMFLVEGHSKLAEDVASIAASLHTLIGIMKEKR